eukprot:TRINITY_DN30914_c0_g1_i1.p1 TRINITY_DN30914_c0_g1~~TRINITY_DN30914_c0_g1_i1.p1  ORF type:complete len:619 (-),score=94.17 TRINITY_DN30914_c0_g1_i1:251-2107(-)
MSTRMDPAMRALASNESAAEAGCDLLSGSDSAEEGASECSQTTSSVMSNSRFRQRLAYGVVGITAAALVAAVALTGRAGSSSSSSSTSSPVALASPEDSVSRAEEAYNARLKASPRVLRGCGMPIEQVHLILPAGDWVSSGSITVHWLGGSDAARVVSTGGTFRPERIPGYDNFEHKDGQRLFNVAKLTGFQPGVHNYTIVDDPAADGWDCQSERQEFASTFVFGPKTKNVQLAVFGDMGVDFQSKHGGCFGWHACWGAGRVRQLVEQNMHNFDAVFNIGDIAYATGKDGVWDDYGLGIQKVASKVPWMTAVGNHEWGTDARCECGTPYSFRFPMPVHNGKGLDFVKHTHWRCHTSVHNKREPSCEDADDDMAMTWKDVSYSVDIGDVRVVVVSTQHGINPGTEHFEWLSTTLQTNPKKWQVVMGHIDGCYPCDPLLPNVESGEPCYCWEDGGPSGEYGATSMNVVQRLLVQYQLPADLVMTGHTHEYYVRNCTTLPECYVGDNIPTVVVGGAGFGADDKPGDYGKARPGPPFPHKDQQCSHAPYGYTEVTFTDDEIQVLYRDIGVNGATANFQNMSCHTDEHGGCPAKLADSADDLCSVRAFVIKKGKKSTITSGVL